MQPNYAETLEKDIKEFEAQRERVRAIIGQIGGKPTVLKKLSNIVFVVLVLACFILSLIFHGKTNILLLEIIILLASAKFIYFLYLQNRVMHFQFWILSTMEWRLNEVSQSIQEIEAKMKEK